MWGIQHGADLNAADASGQTALLWAAVRGALPAAETLLRAGARIDQTDNKGYGVSYATKHVCRVGHGNHTCVT